MHINNINNQVLSLGGAIEKFAPDRSYSVFLVVQSLSQTIYIFSVSHKSDETWGVAGETAKLIARYTT